MSNLTYINVFLPLNSWLLKQLQIWIDEQLNWPTVFLSFFLTPHTNRKLETWLRRIFLLSFSFFCCCGWHSSLFVFGPEKAQKKYNQLQRKKEKKYNQPTTTKKRKKRKYNKKQKSKEKLPATLKLGKKWLFGSF